MLPKNIPLYKLDLTGKNPNNLITQEYYQRLDVEHELTIILRSGPFYADSLSLYTPEGTVLVENEDYEILGIAQALTAFVKDKEVSMMILLKNEKLTEFFADYQIVGHFSIVNKDLVDLVNGALEDGRPVKWGNINNKPLWFNPELHLHDLRYEIHSFQDLIDCIKRIKDVKAILPNRELVSIDQFYSVINSRIDEYEKRLLAYIKQHDSDFKPPYTNSHGLTAKQVDLEKVDNFETATLLDILDGFRRDLHVTADYVKQAIDFYGKETDNLVKVGSLPILRYGSNSFIPTPITGSYEGMGGSDFYVASNIESDGTALILGPRNDGRTRGLYFMQNTDPNYTSDKWKFTSYKYEHQTPTSEGVTLTALARGSNGKLLILSGVNSNNQKTWYWALGNGTFDPLKHKLEKLPDDMQGLSIHAFLCTDAFPTKVFLFDIINGGEAYNDLNLRNIAYDFPADVSEIVNKGVIINAGFAGLYCWEFDVSSRTWRKITFNYQQAITGQSVSNPAWFPWRVTVKEVDANNVRVDDSGFNYGVKSYQFSFTKLISSWVMRLWWNEGLDKYDEENDRLAFKYLMNSYGQDERQALFEMGLCSIGAYLKNRKIVNNVLYYDVENKKALSDVTYFDTTVAGSNGNTAGILSGKVDHIEYSGFSGAGNSTVSWFSKGKILYAFSPSLGTFPVRISIADLNGTAVFEDLEKYVTTRFNAELTANANIKTTTYLYNETNPANLTIGFHSTFWVQLDQNDPNSMGAVSLGTSEDNPDKGILIWRRQPALNSQGYPVEPTTKYNLYPESIGKGRNTLGYSLNNDTLVLDNQYNEVFTHNVFINIANNRKAEYSKNLIAHQGFKSGSGYVNNDTADTNFISAYKIETTDNKITFTPTETYDLENQIKNILIPKLEAYTKTLSNADDISTENMLATHRIMFTNLPSAKYDKFLIFSAGFVDKVTGLLSTAAITFNLNGGTLDNGVIKNATVTPVGDVKHTNHVYLTENSLPDVVKAGYTFSRDNTYTITQPRDLVMQLEAGKSFIVAQMSYIVSVKGNRHNPGAKFIVDETGITEITEGSVYYVSSLYKFFLHPYYGACSRVANIGPSEIGYPWMTPTSANVVNDTTKLVLGNSNYLEGAFSIYFSVEQNVVLNGREFTLPSSIRDLSTIISNPRNRTFYIYLDYNSDGAFYNITLSPLTETASRGLISIVKTNDDSIYSIENYNVFTMNGIRISAIRHGSVIPAATGTIEESGQLENWVTQNRD